MRYLRAKRSKPARKTGGWRTIAALLISTLLCGAFLVTSGGTASAAAPDTHRLATWNMQRGTDRWAGALNLSNSADVVALQEAPSTPPAGAQPLHGNYGAGIHAYRIPGGRQRGVRYLFILHQEIGRAHV